MRVIPFPGCFCDADLCVHVQILSMIEEAAGTRLYESKKQVAQKTIEKKDAKLKEINDVRNKNKM